MGETQRGTLALALEPTPFQGRQFLLLETAGAATLSLTTQPSAAGATVLMHLHVVIKGATTSGTVSLTGKKSDGTTIVTETSPTLPAANAEQFVIEYCTEKTYSTVDANGIAISGLTNGTITIYGIIAGTKLIPATYDPEEEFERFSAEDHRGIMFRHVRDVQLNKQVSFDVESALYPDTCTWIGFAGFSNNPTISTIPASPTSLLVSTAVSGGPLSLTSQPATPGQLLQLTVTGTSANGSITLAGKNQYGQSAQETIICIGGAGTYFSQSIFSWIDTSGITITGLSGGSLAVGGFFATRWIFLVGAGNPLQTASLAGFSGTESAVYPFTLFEEISLDMDVEKENKLSAKVMSQDKVMLGNRMTSPLSVSRLPILGQPTDLPIVGWQSQFFIDPLSNTAFTTPYLDLYGFKLQVNTGMTPRYTATNSQVYNRVYQDGSKVEVSFDATIDFRDAREYEMFRQNVKRIFGARFVGPYIGNAGGPIYKSWSFTLPARYQSFPIDRGELNVTAKITGQCEYEPSLGYGARLEIINQAPPNYQFI